MSLGGMQNQPAQSAIKALVRDWIGTRKRVDFWVFLDKDYDVEVFEIIQKFKRLGLFRRSVMIGLRIMWEYREGRADTVKQELPKLAEMLGVKPPEPDSDLRDEIRELKRMMLEQGGNTIQPQTLIMKSVTPSAPAPVAEVKQAAAVSADTIADNFLSMFQ